MPRHQARHSPILKRERPPCGGPSGSARVAADYSLEIDPSELIKNEPRGLPWNAPDVIHSTTARWIDSRGPKHISCLYRIPDGLEDPGVPLAGAVRTVQLRSPLVEHRFSVAHEQ